MTGDGAARGPVVWAMAVREAVQGPPIAELIVEVGANLHADLFEAAVDSGFTVAAGEPPATTGVIEVGGGRVERLLLVGGRQGWEPGSRVEVSPRWLAAAEGRGEAVVVVVPPPDWPLGPVDEDPGTRVDAFTRWVEDQRVAGRVLHGAVSVRGWA